MLHKFPQHNTWSVIYYVTREEDPHRKNPTKRPQGFKKPNRQQDSLRVSATHLESYTPGVRQEGPAQDCSIMSRWFIFSSTSWSMVLAMLASWKGSAVTLYTSTKTWIKESKVKVKGHILYHQVWAWLAVTSCLENPWLCPRRCMTGRRTFATVHLGRLVDWSTQHTSRWPRPPVMSEEADFQNLVVKCPPLRTYIKKLKQKQCELTEARAIMLLPGVRWIHHCKPLPIVCHLWHHRWRGSTQMHDGRCTSLSSNSQYCRLVEGATLRTQA